MKITRIGMYPTDCHSDEGECGNNIVFTRKKKCALRLKGAAVVGFQNKIRLTAAGDVIVIAYKIVRWFHVQTVQARTE